MANDLVDLTSWMKKRRRGNTPEIAGTRTEPVPCSQAMFIMPPGVCGAPVALRHPCRDRERDLQKNQLIERKIIGILIKNPLQP